MALKITTKLELKSSNKYIEKYSQTITKQCSLASLATPH